jgi:hypothetical protein
MRVIQPFTEQDIMSLHRTLLDAMEGSMTDEATTSTKKRLASSGERQDRVSKVKQFTAIETGLENTEGL